MDFIRSARAAEENAARIMHVLGYSDAAVTPVGRDGGVDVAASGALAQVKWQGAAAGRPDLQRLFGARLTETHKQLLFFAASGFASTAVEYADQAAIALFIYDPTGEVEPMNVVAEQLISTAMSKRAEDAEAAKRAEELAVIDKGVHPVVLEYSPANRERMRRLFVRQNCVPNPQDYNLLADRAHRGLRMINPRIGREYVFYAILGESPRGSVVGLWACQEDWEEARRTRVSTVKFSIVMHCNPREPHQGDMLRLSLAEALVMRRVALACDTAHPGLELENYLLTVEGAVAVLRFDGQSYRYDIEGETAY